MSYKHTNKLKQIKQVQDVFFENKQDGVSTTYIYQNIIYPRFFISRTTFYTYMSTPVHKLLRSKSSTDATP